MEAGSALHNAAISLTASGHPLTGRVLMSLGLTSVAHPAKATREPPMRRPRRDHLTPRRALVGPSHSGRGGAGQVRVLWLIRHAVFSGSVWPEISQESDSPDSQRRTSSPSAPSRGGGW